MREPPDGADLLATAREALRAEIIPALPESLRYTALMIARAMTLAQHELENREGDTPGEPAFLAGLARAIRAGAYDAPGEERSAVRAALIATVERRLRETNPRLLEPG